MGDVAHSTQLVAIGNDGTDAEVWYEDTDGSMTELDTSADRLVKEVQMAVVAGFQKVFIADGTHFKYIKFDVSPPTYHNWQDDGTWSVDQYDGGTLPAGANIGCLYRARIVLAGATANPNQWYMSRQGEPRDWTYAANDAQSPVSGGDSIAAQSGDIITALIPYSDDYLVIGGAHSVELMRGDPAAGGSLDEVLGSDGIFGPQSYCFDGEGNLYFQGTTGTYKMSKGGSIPEPISVQRLPKMMDGIDRDNYRIVMAYDARRYGILICMTKISDGTGTHWWYDLKTKGFFPESYLSGMGPYSVAFYDSDDDDYRRLLLGCGDGYIRYFDESEKSDEAASGANTAINSKVLLGPVDLSTGGMQGRINNLILTMGSGADTCNYDIFVNNSAEELYDDVIADNTPLFAGTTGGGGRRVNIRSRARGAALAVKLKNSTIARSFAIENIEGNVVTAGRLRI